MVNKHVFIGREKELETLHNAYKEATTGKGKLVLVSGNTGLGKSALIKTFFSQIEKDENTISGFSECTDMEDQNPYAPIKNLFIELHARAYSKKITTEKLKELMAEAGPAWIGAIPGIGGLLSAATTSFQSWRKIFSKNKNKPIIENENDVFRIFENEFRRLAKKKTLVVCIDDLQWADTSSLNVLYKMGRLLRNNPFKILIIGSYRPNDIELGRKKDTEDGLVTVPHPFTDKLNELRNYTKKQIHEELNPNWFNEIELEAFTKTEFEEYASVIFPNNNFSKSFLTTIYELTDGDPLFVAEILEQLYLNHSIELIEGVYSAKNVHVDELPKSVSASISQKVGRLNEALKDVLTYASVSGETFMVDIIEEIVDINRFKLLKHLKNLDKTHNLVIEEEPLSINGKQFNRYQFSRSLVQKYIYKTLLSSAEKRELHQFISKILLSIYGEKEINDNQNIKDKYLLHKQIGSGLLNSDDYSINTFSDNQPNETKPKIEEYITAAKEALQKAKESYEQFAMDESLDFVDKTLAFLSKIEGSNGDTPLLRFHALLWRNKSLQWQGHYQQAFDTAEEASKMATQIQNEEYIAQANLALGVAKSSLGYGKDALEYFTRSIAYYETTDNHASLWKAYQVAGKANNERDSYDEAIVFFEKALVISEKITDPIIKGRTLLELGKSYSSKLQENDAIDYFEQALNIFEENKNKYWIGQAYNKIGLEFRSQSDTASALEFIEKALLIAQKQNDLVNISNRTNNIALTYEGDGDFEKSIEYYKQCLDIDKQLDNKPMIAKSMNNIGGVYASMGDFEMAMDYLDKSHEIIKSINNPRELSSSYFTLSQAFTAMNDYKKAAEYILKAIEISVENKNIASSALYYSVLADLYETNIGNKDLALQYFRNSLELFIEVGNDKYVDYTNDRLSSLNKVENTEIAVDHAGSAAPDDKQSVKSDTDKLEKSIIKDLEDYFSAGYEHFEKGAYPEAIKNYNKALESLTFLPDDDASKKSKANIYFQLGQTNKYARDNDAAIENYINSYNYYVKLSEVNKDDVGMVCLFLGDVYYFKNDYKNAIENHKEALELLNKPDGSNNDKLAWANFNLGNDYHWNKNYEEAIIHYRKSLKIKTEILGNEHKEVANCYVQIGKSYFEKGDKLSAIQNLKNAFEINKNLYGEKSREADEVMVILGQAYYYSERKEEAKGCLDASLAFRKEFFGEASEEYLFIKNWIDENFK